MKFFKIFLIIFFVFSLFSISLMMAVYITPITEILEMMLPFPGFIGTYQGFLIYNSSVGFVFAFLAPLSFALFAFLNAKKSGSKAWYVIFIISFLIFCYYAFFFARNILRATQPIPPPPALPSLLNR